MSASEEPACWNCGVLARVMALRRDGTSWLCRGCDEEINAVISQGKAWREVNGFAQEVVG